jgi:tetratricopeptide (TPR) repeat protein/energy-coupling factor transporter ATP-binding protein EcfA2
MSLVAHKYTPAEMSPQELEATFAARGHTLDYMLKSLREQIHSGTLSSFIITGPRGSGKSTLIQLVALRISRDSKLKAAWTPVVFPEEQFNIASLRDLMAATLQVLVKQGVSQAPAWLEKVETETNEEQSLQLAITGLREITRKHGKRLILFIENLNLLLGECLDDQMKGTFRRLLMSDPFMMVIGSAVHEFDSLKSYDEAFFNYFGQVPLGRLTTEDVFDLLRLRANFDGNQEFLRQFPGQQSKIRAIVHLSGGNPRLILMLYELLTQRQVTTSVQCLRRLVDELTPLLKHEIENLPPQQRLIIHALMERGGAAQPSDLVARTRLPLNAITTQLGRLKEAQFVEVLGGGKGRTANYIVPDKLFAVWYQMRYLNLNRRRIEMFVEVLRVWFEPEERFTNLCKLASQGQRDAPQILRDAMTAEYFAASLKGTLHERLAIELCIDQWVMVDLREALLAYADFYSGGSKRPDLDEMQAYTGVGDVLLKHGDYQRAIQSLDEVIAKQPRDVNALYKRGFAKRQLGDNLAAISDCTAVIKLEQAPKEQVARALVDRGVAKGLSGDVQGAMTDCSSVIELVEAPEEQIALALFNRGIAKGKVGDVRGAISDYTAVVEMKGASDELMALALFNRSLDKRQMGDNRGAISDYNALIAMNDVPCRDIARALFNRGNAKHDLGDMAGAIFDYSTLIKMEDVPMQDVARAFVNRGVTKNLSGDAQGAIFDWSAVIDMVGAPNEQLARALFSRWLAFRHKDKNFAAVEDLVKVVELAVMKDGLVVHAAKIAFGILWLRKDHSRAKAVVTKLGGVLNSVSNELASAASLQFLNSLASPGMKDAWPTAWRVLAETARPETAEPLQFLKPVCDVLEGKERTILDGLPPEQREFAEAVLRRFDANVKES